MMLFYASNSWAKSGSFLLVILTGEQHNLLNFHFYIFSSSLNTYIYMYCIYIFLLNTWGHESCAFEWHESHLGFILLCETKSVVQLWWMNKFSIVFWLYVEHVISNVKDIILLMSCQIDDSPCILYSDLENPCSCIHIPLILDALCSIVHIIYASGEFIESNFEWLENSSCVRGYFCLLLLYLV